MKKYFHLTLITLLLQRTIVTAAPFVPDESAPRTISQLESSGQIQTKPSAIAQWWWDVKHLLGIWWDAFWRWLEHLFPSPKFSFEGASTSSTWIKVLFIGALILALIAAGLLLWRAWKNASPRQMDEFEEDDELFLLPPDELRARAKKFASAGNYREALRYLYISTLMLIDARGIWHYDINRTNWEHIAQLSREVTRTDLVAPLSEMTRQFDRVRYGNAPCNDADWQRFERKYNELEAQLPILQTS